MDKIPTHLTNNETPAWRPTAELLQNANLALLMKAVGCNTVADFHRFSTEHYTDFWQLMIDTLPIIFKKPSQKIVDLSHGIESPEWFPGAEMNIADSCLTAPRDAIAIIEQDASSTLRQMSYDELDRLSNRIANGLVAQGFVADDAIAIIMPMHAMAVAIYLGIIKMGGVVVSIADSFTPNEIATRLTIANTKAVFTQDQTHWDNKIIPLYEKIKSANAPAVILLSEKKSATPLRTHDIAWDTFLVADDQFNSVARLPASPCNILFSSGTTANPKAIPWTQTTPIKAASDAYLHQNIAAHDVLAWPTNLGWMMGPWLIYAALINHATLALYTETPKNKAFGEFVAQANVTMLGVVPTLVTAWRQSQCMEGLDWQAIKLFSSTGECSNVEDMRYLMSLAGNKPIIEYCGGTEIGGAYISSTLLQDNYPSLFSTPAFGLNFSILGDEVAIIPPSIGLSNTLLNANHHDIYYAGMPAGEDGKTLRRHGDQIKPLPNGYYCLTGRTDDAMNLGGIKISAAEIERAVDHVTGVRECAAIAISHQGPSQLVIYVVVNDHVDKETLKKAMQKEISTTLNPLFKIHEIVIVNELPKTASNKIMRRVLREKHSS